MLRNIRGFTLVEMMTVVAIVAILAALSLPAYSKYVERSRRIEGQVLANQVAQAQERHFATYNRYANSLVGAGLDNLGFVATCGGVVGSETCQYRAQVDTQNVNQNFVVTVIPTAPPVGKQSLDKCASLTLSGTGTKGYSGDDTNGKCW